MSARSTGFFCFRSLEARDSRPEGLLLYKVYNLAAINNLTVCFAKASIGKEIRRPLHVTVIMTVLRTTSQPASSLCSQTVRTSMPGSLPCSLTATAAAWLYP